MINCQTTVKDNKLTIVVDLAKKNGLSKSGKSFQIASSGGNQSIGQDGIKFGLNVYKPNPEYAPA
jgi:hypothetical protein